jgi:hypothetical protein
LGPVIRYVRSFGLDTVVVFSVKKWTVMEASLYRFWCQVCGIGKYGAGYRYGGTVLKCAKRSLAIIGLVCCRYQVPYFIMSTLLAVPINMVMLLILICVNQYFRRNSASGAAPEKVFQIPVGKCGLREYNSTG